MGQQTINNGDTGLVARTKINENFTEVYNPESLTIGSTGTPPITPVNFISRKVNDSASGAKLNGIFYLEQSVATSGSAQGVEGYVKTSNPTGAVVLAIGVVGNIEHSGAGDLDYARPVQSGGIVSGNGTVTEWAAFYAQPVAITGGGVVENVFGLYLDIADAGGGTINNRYGVYQLDPNAVNLFKGLVLVGGTSITPSAIMDLQSTTHAFIPPRMTTTQRDAIASPSAGMIIYNTTTNKLNVYESSWGEVGGATSGTYTPTLTNVSNLDGSTTNVCQWMRVGGVVTVSGRLAVNPTAAGPTYTELGISLPVASDFSSIIQACGTAFTNDLPGQGAFIEADSTNNRMRLGFYADDTNNQDLVFTAIYLIV